MDTTVTQRGGGGCRKREREEKGKERRVKSRLLEERDELHALMRFELVGGDTQSADQMVKQRPALDRHKRTREERKKCGSVWFGRVCFLKFLFKKSWNSLEREGM